MALWCIPPDSHLPGLSLFDTKYNKKKRRAEEQPHVPSRKHWVLNRDPIADKNEGPIHRRETEPSPFPIRAGIMESCFMPKVIAYQCYFVAESTVSSRSSLCYSSLFGGERRRLAGEPGAHLVDI